MDFNIIYDNCGVKDNKVEEKIKKAFELGYETVAVNTIVESSCLAEKNVRIPDPKEITIKCTSGFRKLKILNRLTAIISESINAHHLMQSPIAKKYDLISVQPVGEKMTHHACVTLDVDIITFDFRERLLFSFKRTYMTQAKKKGVVFEIQYSPSLRDQTARRYIIANAQNMTDILKGSNIIVSSGAENTLELRGVHDVENLSHLFGLNTNGCVAAVRTNGNIVLSHADTRIKTGWGYVSVENMFKLAKQDRWLVSACRVPKKNAETVDKLSDSDDIPKEPEPKKSKLSKTQD